ncbi:MAG: hypothetical protein WDZ49_15530, partial [Litorilinea sp.]
MIEPQSFFWTTLFSIVPWNQAKIATQLLHQSGHGLLGDGFLQARRRKARREVDILCLAPTLVSAEGHPAIWEKLLGHYNQVAAQQRIERIFADVDDQPLPVATFSHAGYRVYSRQTIWRLSPHRIDDYAGVISAYIRPQAAADRWGLTRLYAQTVPKPVQMAEGAGGANAAPPIFHWPHCGVCTAYVLEENQEIHGLIQIVEGQRGVWFQLWVDSNNPNPYRIHELLRYGLSVLHRRAVHKPVYVGVHDYQRGLNAALTDYGFAPVTDLARMVRPVTQWVRDVQTVTAHRLETSPQIAIAPFDAPPLARKHVPHFQAVTPTEGAPGRQPPCGKSVFEPAATTRVALRIDQMTRVQKADAPGKLLRESP